ncbi:MAG: hypothetical protein CR988_00640 [Treponema sp.]|nr:MAG: hypothetical protein CR988_00640 [Treponema sp.]
MSFKFLKNTRPLDFIFIAGLIIAIIFTAKYAFNKKNDSLYVKIKSPLGVWVYPLNKDITVNISGAVGKTVVEIKGGSISVISSPCPNKTCVNSMSISKPNSWIACLPNKVIVFIEGGEDKNSFLPF